MKNCRNKGSLTVEAIIVFPVFLLFFMTMMYFVKVSNTCIVLNHAVNQTTKQIATESYWMVTAYDKANDKTNEGDLKKELKNKNEEQIKNNWIDMVAYEKFNIGNPERYEDGLLKGNTVQDFDEEDIEQTPVSLVGNCTYELVKIYVGNKTQEAIKSRLKKYESKLRKDLKEEAEKNIKEQLEDSVINENDLSIEVLKLPKEKFEDFHDDDVVLQAEYKMKLQLPLIGEKKFVIRRTCVEKAWTKGWNGEHIKKDKSIW